MAKGLLQHVLGGIFGQAVPEAKHQLLSEVPLLSQRQNVGPELLLVGAGPQVPQGELGGGFPRLRKSRD